ncbi:MAG: hypothetical protein KDI09_12045, partial [Halioglobus sp.]|nr:hypothetical protein [Halioglobus sp.]
MLQSNSSLTVTLRHLVVVRLSLLGILVLGMVLLDRHLDIDLSVKPLAIVIAVALLATFSSWWWIAAHPSISDSGTFKTQLMIDIAALTAILYFTGGWTNPLVSLYLVPIAVAAVALSTRSTWLFTAACIVAYSVLTRYYVPLFHLHSDDGPGFTLHVLGMWLTFVAAGLLLAYFGTSMAAARRQQATALTHAREQNMRNEQILGIA